MSRAITRKSLRVPKADKRDRRGEARKRSSFLRLYGDFVDELNNAVRNRVEQGETHAAIAEKAGLDPATLSRVLSGRAGSNLRTIAAVLHGADYRVKIEAVPCERLHLWACTPEIRKHQAIHVLDFTQQEEGRWTIPAQWRDGVEMEVTRPPVRLNRPVEHSALWADNGEVRRASEVEVAK